MKQIIISTIVRKAVEAVRKAVDMAIMAVRKAEIKPPTIVRKAVEVAIVAVRTAVINDRTKFTSIKRSRPGTKYRQTRTSSNKR